MKKEYIAIAGISIIVYLIFFYPSLIEKGVVPVDAKLHYLIIQDIIHPGQPDLTLNLLHDVGGWLPYYQLLALLSRFVPYVFIIKLLPLIWSTLSAVLAYEIGIQKDKKTGITIAVVFLIMSHTMEIFTVPGAKSIIFPVLLGYILAHQKEKGTTRIGLLISSLFIYPPVFPVLFLVELFNRNRLSWILLIIAVLPLIVMKTTDLSFISYLDAKQMVEFSPMGETPFFYGNSPFAVEMITYFSPLKIVSTFINSTQFSSYSNLFFNLSVFSGIMMLFLIVFTIRYVIKHWKNPLVSLHVKIAIASILLFTVSHIMFYVRDLGMMFWPVSYTKITLPLIMVILGGFSISSFLQKKSRWTTIFLVLIVIILFRMYYNFPFDDGNKACEDYEMYKFISTLPENITIAGHPHQIDCLPLFANRKSISVARGITFAEKEYPIIRRGIARMLEAYYSESEEQVMEYCIKEQVDYILVDDRFFQPEYLEKPDMREPFKTMIKSHQKESYYLTSENHRKSTYSENGIFLLPCT